MDEFAGYVDFKQDINSWLSLDAGVRIDHHSQDVYKRQILPTIRKRLPANGKSPTASMPNGKLRYCLLYTSE